MLSQGAACSSNQVFKEQPRGRSTRLLGSLTVIGISAYSALPTSLEVRSARAAMLPPDEWAGGVTGCGL